MSASVNTTRSAVAASTPALTAAPLPACGRRRTRRRGAASVRAGLRLRTGLHERGGLVREPSSTTSTSHGPSSSEDRPPGPRRARAPQPAEQLVERRAEPLRLVVGGQHDRDAGPGSGRARAGRSHVFVPAGGRCRRRVVHHRCRLPATGPSTDGPMVPRGAHRNAPDRTARQPGHGPSVPPGTRGGRCYPAPAMASPSCSSSSPSGRAS